MAATTENLIEKKMGDLKTDLFEVGSLKGKTKLYHQNFVEKNKDRIKEKHFCPVCFGVYTYFNKSQHMRSKRHTRAQELNNQIDESTQPIPAPQ